MPQSFVSAAKVDITVAGNTIYVVHAATKTTLIGLSVANKSNAAITSNVWVTRSAVDYTIAANVTISSGSSFVPVGIDQKMILLAADALKVSVSTAGAGHVIASGLELS